QRVNSHRHTDGLQFFNLLTSPELFQEVEACLPEHRERLFPPTETLSLFLSQVMSSDQSCQHIVNQAAVQKIAMGLPACSTHTGAYCRARQRLPQEMIERLTRFIGASVSERMPDTWRWRQRRVLLVDGTTVTMPDTPANQARFPQQGGQLPGLGFPICRIVGITCLGSGGLLNAAIGRFNGKGSGEQGLLRSLQGTFASGDVVMGDAFYATYFFMAEMMAKGVDLVLEQHGSRKRKTDFRRGRRLAERDHLIELHKPAQKPDWMTLEAYAAAPASITVRECKTAGCILVTTICDRSIHKSELGELYKQRWQVELDLRNIKETMGMNILTCKTPDMAIKEIWVTLLAYNLIRLLMAQSASLADVLPRCLSFKHCLQLWRAWCQRSTITAVDGYCMLFELMAQQRVGNRPGRIEPRAVKRRPKAYPLLRKPRPQARQQVLDFGHPKKLK
ncbi:MAG: IS4 family transposase, partial [Gammaproteobacteria bacterium]|nr:IS4 family transposase [Gammaproteobacteria bacterium]